MIGQTLSHYRIVDKLGAGGMGEVYKARDERLDRDVAIKVLRGELASEPERLRRFEQEARAASALNHPNIITIYDIRLRQGYSGQVGKTQDIDFIVMEFVEGKTVRELVSEGPLPVEKLLRFATQIAEGLAKAHRADIIHRDLKPENLMVTSDGYVKILDFGLAKLLPQPGIDSEAATITKEGTVAGAVMGTASYMSPEQALGKPLDARTDVFSFGAVLYEMATGGRAFAGETHAALFNEILHKNPPLASALNPEMPNALDVVVQKSLDKNPALRYPSAQELLIELRAVQASPTLLLSKPEKSIVVLPFENISPDPEQEYFCDGITDEIISDLSKVESLRVISRNSAMTFKGTKKKVQEIAGEVNVRYVLGGSVRKAGNNLRITAQLVDASRDAHVWTEKYSGTLDDVFDIQEKVSRSIVDALKLKLTPEEERRLAERPIENVQAYECYHRARQEVWSGTEEGLNRAFQFIQRAFEIIGENELLYAAKGIAHVDALNFLISPDEVHLKNVEDCANNIYRLNPDSSHGHLLSGAIHYKRGNVQEALRKCKQALLTDPNNPETVMYLAGICGFSGKNAVALQYAGRLLEIDPLTPLSQCWWAWVSLLGGQFESALDPVRKTYKMAPENLMIAWMYMMSLAINSNVEEASAIADQMARTAPGMSMTQHALFLKYALQGEASKALEAVTPQLIATARWDEHFSWAMADCYALIDHKEEALEWLEHAALSRGFINYPLLAKYDPFLEKIRGDDRFDRLMEEVKYRWEHFEV